MGCKKIRHFNRTDLSAGLPLFIHRSRHEHATIDMQFLTGDISRLG